MAWTFGEAPVGCTFLLWGIEDEICDSFHSIHLGPCGGSLKKYPWPLSNCLSQCLRYFSDLRWLFCWPLHPTRQLVTFKLCLFPLPAWNLTQGGLRLSYTLDLATCLRCPQMFLDQLFFRPSILHCMCQRKTRDLI